VSRPREVGFRFGPEWLSRFATSESAPKAQTQRRRVTRTTHVEHVEGPTRCQFWATGAASFGTVDPPKACTARRADVFSILTGATAYGSSGAGSCPSTLPSRTKAVGETPRHPSGIVPSVWVGVPTLQSFVRVAIVLTGCPVAGRKP